MPKKSRPTKGDCTQGLSKKDRDQLFSKLEEMAKKLRGVGMQNVIRDKVKKKCKVGSGGKSKKKKKSKKSLCGRGKLPELKSLPSSSFISSQCK